MPFPMTLSDPNPNFKGTPLFDAKCQNLYKIEWQLQWNPSGNLPPTHQCNFRWPWVTWQSFQQHEASRGLFAMHNWASCSSWYNNITFQKTDSYITYCYLPHLTDYSSSCPSIMHCRHCTLLARPLAMYCHIVYRLLLMSLKIANGRSGVDIQGA